MHRRMVNNLIKEGWLRRERIIKAFLKIKREDFVPQTEKVFAYADRPLPIGWGQTISQPQVVAFMIELLDPKPGEKILDVGFGSGWTSALLAEIVGEEGRVVAIERILQLKEFGEKNIAKYNFIKKGIVRCVWGDGSKGYQKMAPFDKILCSASLQKKIPESWKEQLKTGGLIVTPMGYSVYLFRKKNMEELEKKEYPGFLFVPLIEE